MVGIGITERVTICNHEQREGGTAQKPNAPWVISLLSTTYMQGWFVFEVSHLWVGNQYRKPLVWGAPCFDRNPDIDGVRKEGKQGTKRMQ